MAFSFYDCRDTISKYPEASYYVIYGERSNGKTYSALDYCLERYFRNGEQFAYVRRWGEDIKRKEMQQLFAGHVANKRVERWSTHKYSGVEFYAGQFFGTALSSTKSGVQKVTKTEQPIGFAFDINNAEHYKSISYPAIGTIVFDEFLSRNMYIPNEFVLFCNLLSTIIRHRNNVKIIMLGNPVNRYSPYFEEMGFKHIKEQKPGTVDIYKYGDSGLIVIVEFCQSSDKKGGKASDVYFAFDNPGLQMIKSGVWEMSIYPHLLESYRPKDVVQTFFIEFDRDILHCDIIANSEELFMFIHRKTTPIKNERIDIVYTTHTPRAWNYRSCLTKCRDRLSAMILKLVNEDRVFYSTNEVGEVFRNYIIWSASHDIRM